MHSSVFGNHNSPDTKHPLPVMAANFCHVFGKYTRRFIFVVYDKIIMVLDEIMLMQCASGELIVTVAI
jgi:hypothetical protein